MKLDCEVIRDLLPLYCEDIASKKSRQLVEEHCAECVECNDMLKNMSEGEIVIEDNGNGLKNFMNVYKTKFNMLLSVFCYTLLMTVACIHELMVQGINILYVLLLLPLGAYCCSRALGAQEFWLKYIFPVACGLFEMCYMNVLKGEPIELDIILFCFSFIPAVIGLIIGIVRLKTNLVDFPRMYNEGMIAGVVMLFFTILSVGEGLIFWPLLIGGMLTFGISYMVNRKNKW